MRRSAWLYPLLLVALALTVLADEESEGNEETTRLFNPDVGNGNDVPKKGFQVHHMIKQAPGFIHAVVGSFSVIVVSEIGDKTFFIAAIMAMKHSRAVVFGGAIGALALMTILSAALGFATTIIPKIYTHYASILLFIFFGLKLLKEGLAMSDDEGKEELEEVTLELRKREEELEKRSKGDIEEGSAPSSFKSVFARLGPEFAVVLSSFTLTFLAEWGDRSQIATIVLAAREDPVGVTLGGIVGHALCTGIAVIGGRLLAQRISVRTVTIVGGVVFLLFALTAFLRDPNEE
eukprot:Colp12_sorted_trinity150504_noHs@8194